jgi:hypothetical protein
MWPALSDRMGRPSPPSRLGAARRDRDAEPAARDVRARRDRAGRELEVPRPSLVRRPENRCRRADGQCAGLDLGRQGCGFAADVAVELAVGLAVDPNRHPSAGVLVNLVIPLRLAGDQPQTQLDPVPESAWRGDVEIQDALVRTRARSQGRVAPSLPTLPATQNVASRLTGRWSSSCTLIGKGSRRAPRESDQVLQVLIGLVHDHRVGAANAPLSGRLPDVDVTSVATVPSGARSRASGFSFDRADLMRISW